MNQNINLRQALPKRTANGISTLGCITVLLASIFFCGSLSVWVKIQTLHLQKKINTATLTLESLTEELKKLTANLPKDNNLSLEENIKHLTALVTQQREFQKFLNKRNNNNQKISTVFLALAHTKTPHLWLQYIEVNNINNSLTLNGQALQTLTITDYLQWLSKNSALALFPIPKVLVEKNKNNELIFNAGNILPKQDEVNAPHDNITRQIAETAANTR